MSRASEIVPSAPRECEPALFLCPACAAGLLTNGRCAGCGFYDGPECENCGERGPSVRFVSCGVRAWVGSICAACETLPRDDELFPLASPPEARLNPARRDGGR